ncbi:MAG: histidinol-phosphate transaminase [Burkholderiales bacterium]|nr:histidinol-phosphate transaminase [Burkholderiales bacterium]
MSRYWSDVVDTLTPYVPGEQPKIDKLIKLNTNENPYPPSPRVIEALKSESDSSLRLYPDPNADRLKRAIADFYGIRTDSIFVGNGSDEVLAHVFCALFKHENPILFPDVTYSFYPVYAKLYGIAFETVALDESFRINVNDYFRPNGGIIFPNPNAPTGCLLDLDAIETLAEKNPDSVLAVDEAYIDFGGDSAVSLTEKYPNLLVIQTLSKSRALAGLRVGLAVGNPDLIEALERVKNSFNSYPLGRLAISGGAAAFEDREYFETIRASVISSRERLARSLEKLGFFVLPSKANFVLARHPGHDAALLAAKLRENRIIVRHFRLPRIEAFLRITVGTEEECNMLIANLGEMLRD